MRKAYFPKQEGAPAPLRHTVQRRVRFEEVDPLTMVWHGRYPSYFEDARVALGDAYGIGYLDFYRHNVLAPVKKMHLDYIKPLRYPEIFTVEAVLHWTAAARMNYEFIIRNDAGEVTTRGCSVQMFVEENGELLIVPPAFYLDFITRWKDGKLS